MEGLDGSVSDGRGVQCTISKLVLRLYWVACMIS